MDKKKIILITFLIAAAVQLAVPASMILRREITLKNGRQFKFKTAPVDPYDAFRGRYVALRMEESSVLVDMDSDWKRGQWAYVVVKEDAEGFASLLRAERKRPGGDNYIKVQAAYYHKGDKLNLNLPFDRYYMNENDAPAAETAYRKHSNRKERDAYVTVRVLNGFAILEELYVSGMPIGDFLKQQPSE